MFCAAYLQPESMRENLWSPVGVVTAGLGSVAIENRLYALILTFFRKIVVPFKVAIIS